MTFTRKTVPLIATYEIEGEDVRRVNSVQDLGVQFDPKLLFTSHVENVVAKARKKLGIMRWISRDFQNANTLMCLYTALVSSHLKYASVIWNRDRLCTSVMLKGIQRKFVKYSMRRFIPGSEDSSYRELCLAIDLENLE
ncbi:uncharacterized protein LOC111054047 [Nilaparvata lugens]|uniref:uncharacterized protein LOC111054047 n=1 Tax=Nilaparvata lugens TaxID=108931 RepID=UPI00193D85E6|nr:uncharacterized protein LOC111054047 [Nilaparvata lugens]